MNSKMPSSKSLLGFFLLIFLISAPLWLVGVLMNQTLPKDAPLYIPVNLLWHIALAFIPMVAALALVYRSLGWTGAKNLLKRPFDYKRIKQKSWYIFILLFFPLLMLLEYGLLAFTGAALPNLLQLSILLAPALFFVFFAAGIGEELGWTGYALDPLQSRWNALAAAVFLGVVSAAFHFVPLIIDGHAPAWIAWHMAHMIPYRVLLVWIYNCTSRSMFAVVAFHSASNIGEVVWPFYNAEGYDPFITTALLTAAALAVVFLWGPRTLAHYRFRKKGASMFGA